MRTSELKKSLNHDDFDIIVLKDRIIESEGLKNMIKKDRQVFENMKDIKFRCDSCKNDIHRAFYAIHLKNRKHSENMA